MDCLQKALETAYARLKPLADAAGLPMLFICPRVSTRKDGALSFAFDFSARPADSLLGSSDEVSAFSFDWKDAEHLFTERLINAAEDVLQESHQLDPCQVGSAYAHAFQALEAVAV